MNIVWWPAAFWIWICVITTQVQLSSKVTERQFNKLSSSRIKLFSTCRPNSQYVERMQCPLNNISIPRKYRLKKNWERHKKTWTCVNMHSVAAAWLIVQWSSALLLDLSVPFNHSERLILENDSWHKAVKIINIRTLRKFISVTKSSSKTSKSFHLWLKCHFWI